MTRPGCRRDRSRAEPSRVESIGGARCVSGARAGFVARRPAGADTRPDARCPPGHSTAATAAAQCPWSDAAPPSVHGSAAAAGAGPSAVGPWLPPHDSAVAVCTVRSSPHPLALSRPCWRPSERVPARPVHTPQPHAGAPGGGFDATERAGRARTVAKRVGTALTGAVRTGRIVPPDRPVAGGGRRSGLIEAKHCSGVNCLE